jgi:type II secretory pathway pseudopilin PulG
MILIVMFVIILAAAVGFNQWQLWRLQQKYASFLKGSNAQNIEDIIKTYTGQIDDAQTKIDEIAEFCAKMIKYQQLAISHVGLVRFNPFGDTGGNQSFCLALLDSDDTGVVISSVHGRNTTRVYAKAINSGKSKYNLSQEENQAIEQAING